MVSDEILEQLKDKFEYDEIGKISFMCHSLGGIVARACFPYLKEYFDKFYSYISLASPHLGVMNAQTHIQVGTWLLGGTGDYK